MDAMHFIKLDDLRAAFILPELLKAFCPFGLRGMAIAGVLANGSPAFVYYLLAAVLAKMMRKVGLNCS